MFLQLKNKKDEPDAILVNNVAKRFKIPHEKKHTLFENIYGLLEGKRYRYEDFWALRNISFTVKRGGTLGIIGQNGSGKSTLLRVIAGVLCPDIGTLRVNGRTAPFLELGVGFQLDLTAEDNVHLYGSILGMSRAQINKKIDDIFEFAEVQKFRNTKLKNFSSGMHLRLAFSTAVAANSDTYLLDEVLAVGDEAFQKKCFEKFEEFKKEGKTIVLVSHSMDLIKWTCKEAILLNNGEITSMGEREKVIEDYRRLLEKKEKERVQ